MKETRLKVLSRSNASAFSVEDVCRAVNEAVEFYNTERPHMSINMQTPVEVSRQTGEIRKRWTSYREWAIRKNEEEICNIAAESLPPTAINKQSQLFPVLDNNNSQPNSG